MLEPAAPIDVFVHLAHGYDARDWERRWLRGQIIGFNERFPYGYHLASDMGCSVRFSRDKEEGRVARWWRLSFRALLGFDLIHAWRNRTAILSAAIVWTHTESQHLAIALLMKMLRPATRPKVIGQSVWLIDRWDRLSWSRRWFYRWLLQEIDVLTFHSPLNTARARDLFKRRPCEFVRFGIRSEDEDKVPATTQAQGERIRVLAVGNDRHRDWDCLIEAFSSRPQVEVHIVSKSISPRRVAGLANIHVHTLRSQGELLEMYRSSDIVVVPLRRNLHASGISCLQEAVLSGKPSVCSRAGGLDSYFDDDEVAFVEPGNADDLCARVLEMASDPHAVRMARKAQMRMGSDGLSSTSFVRRHVELSMALLERGPAPARIAAAAI